MTASTGPNTAKLMGGILGLATVVVGVVAEIYNDKLAGAGIITSGLGIIVHALQ